MSMQDIFEGISLSRKWALENRKLVDKLSVGDVVRATEDLDPQGANVYAGEVGVVFAESDFYKDGLGPMVRWLRINPDGQTMRSGGCCNVYDGQVVLLK